MTSSTDPEQTSVRAGVARPQALVWTARGVVAASVVLVGIWLARPWTMGDTPFVLDGTNAFLDCLSHRDFVACRTSETLDYWGLMSPIGDWPLLQHVPDLAAVGLGVDEHDHRERVLALLSTAGVVGAVVLARIVLRRVGQAAWFWGFLFIALSGPILAFGGTTAGEALAAGLLVALVAATTLRAAPPVVGLAALATCLTKETSYPFVVALGLLGLLLARRRTGEPIRHQVVWGGTGIALGIVLASLFNVVRFGSVLNTNYLQPELHTEGVGRILEYTGALFVSPSGGMVFFWPAASLLLAAACLVPLVFRAGVHLDMRPALVLVAVVAGLTLGFASWWTPFGWAGYGPRFTLPWVPALVLLSLVAYGDALGALARRLLGPTWRLLLVFVVVFSLALPHIGHLWNPEAVGPFFRQDPRQCDAPWRIGASAFHECQHHQLWYSRPAGLYAVEGVRSVGGALASIAVATALLGSLVLLRAQLRPPEGGRLEVRHGRGRPVPPAV